MEDHKLLGFGWLEVHTGHVRKGEFQVSRGQDVGVLVLDGIQSRWFDRVAGYKQKKPSRIDYVDHIIYLCVNC